MSPLRPFRIFLLAGLLSLVLLSGCQEQSAPQPAVLFEIDNRIVTLAQFQKAFRASLSKQGNLTPDELKELQRSFLVQAIDRELILAEAERLGVTVSAAEIEAALNEARRDYAADEFNLRLEEQGLTVDEWRRELHDGMLMEKVVRLAAYPRAAVSAEDVRAAYQQDEAGFNRPEQVRARQILVESIAEGDRLLGLLRSGEPFEKLARLHSLSPDGQQGGDLGFFARGEMPPEFDAVVFSLPTGRVSELVQSPYGVHIFLVEAKRPAKTLTLEEAAAEIRARLLRRAEEAVYQQWLQELRARATININLALLAEGGP